MQFKQLLNDDDAVSPVIGVILMVAITVILAAVIGTFVLGLGDQVQTTAPSHNFDTEAGANTTTFSSTGGQSVQAGNLAFRPDATGNLTDGDGTSVNDTTTWADISDLDSGEDVSAGSSVTIETNEETWGDDDTIALVWEDQGQSSTMTTWEAS